MSGFTSPAASPVALPAKAAPPSLLAPGVPSLAAFIDLMVGKIAPPAAKGAPGGREGQNDAENGKNLPDEDRPRIDPALAWLFGAPPIPVAQPIAIAAPDLKTPVICNVEPEAPPAVAVPIFPMLRADKDAPSPTAPQIEARQPPVSPVILQNKPDVSLPLAPPKAIAPPMMPVPRVAPPMMPLPPVAPPAATLPALFALAMTPAHDTRDDDTSIAPAPLAAAVHATDTTASIAPSSDAQRQALDLGRQDWPQKMIDHIEALRDNANANDTSIRLKPEALGRVDVSLKMHNDGAISVRFTAQQPTTRTLIADAAPQLAAAAEARGIRLSGTSVDLGGQGHQLGDHRPRPEVERPQNISNHLAASGDDDNQAGDDGRVA